MFRNYRVGLLVRTAFKTPSQKQGAAPTMERGNSKLPNIAPLIDGRIEEVCLLNKSNVRNQYQEERLIAEVANANQESLSGSKKAEHGQNEEKAAQKEEEESYDHLSKEELIVMVKDLKKQVAELLAASSKQN